MRITAALFCACWLLISGNVAAQTRPASLSTLFGNVYGPNGLVVNSDEQLLDGTTHAAHFNSAFQSDFRLINIALASQLTALPVPSPASGFIYKFDSTTGTFVRSTRSFGPILADRGETIGKGQISFGINYQYFSFDHLDGVPFTAVPAVFRHDDYKSTPGRSDVIATHEHDQRHRRPDDRGADVRPHRPPRPLDRGSSDRDDAVAAVERDHRAGRYRARTRTRTTSSIRARSRAGATHQFYSAGSATGIGDILVRAKGTLMKEGGRALAAGVDVRFPSGDEENLLGSGAPGLRPFAASPASLGAMAPHVNVAYQWNGKSLLAGDVAARRKADLPDQFVYAVGTDLSVNQRFSFVLDLLGQRIINSPRISTFPFTATGPFGSVALQDITFSSESYWTSYGSVGVKANLAPRLLINFNMRFALNNSGLTDRLTPLIGAEWAF